ncbi:MAG: glycine cleavage system protein GcvH [Deltaproteobacteria bacterium]|nr:glycine cleavage system protein GcvH [Deltaproteobacteria bacterium]
MANFPSDLLYTKDHEWARVDGNKVRVGITQHAVDQLGDITLVNFDLKVGSTLTEGAAFGTVESVKAVSDLFAPLSGTIVEINSALDASPELINDSPYDKGWMVVIEVSGAVSGLMDPAAYSAHVEAG